MLYELRDKISLCPDAEIKFSVHNINFDPPSGEDIAGRLTARVVIEGDMLDDEYVRHFESYVYDGEVETFNHVDEIDWQRWFGDEEEMPKIEGRNVETLIRSAVAFLLNRQEELMEGVPEEGDVKTMLSECAAHYGLDADANDNRNWRVDLYRENDRGESYADVYSRFKSLLDVVLWIESEPKAGEDDGKEREVEAVRENESA